MHLNEMDAYFHAASHGDQNAYCQLYEEFVTLSKIIIKTTLKNFSKYSGIPVDFSELIDNLFFKSLNEYDESKGSYSAFCEFILNRRLAGKVKNAIADINNNYADIDFEDNEDLDTIELLEDPNQTEVLDEIVEKDFQIKIASPNNHKTSEEKLRDRVLLLKYAGYHNTEISRILKIPYTSLRRYLKSISDDAILDNFKIDLK